MSFDDLYNNFKIVEQEVKRTVSSSSNLSSQNVAFVSSPSSTNEVNTANIQVSTASTPVTIASLNDNTANLSDATVYAFLANKTNGSQLVHEDLEQIHDDDLEEMDLKWQLALLSMRAKRYYQRSGKKITINKSDTAGYDKNQLGIYKWYQSLCSETLIKKKQKVRSRNSHKEMDLEPAQNNAIAKLALLKQENGNSFQPVPQTTSNVDGTSTSTIPGPVTIEEKTQKKNDVKARSMLLMALPNEHLLTFIFILSTAKPTVSIAQVTTTAKGEYDMWRLRIEQYFQVQDYALWDVIENGNLFKSVAQTTTNVDGTSTSLIPGPITTEEKAQKKNDVKARSMLLMALPNEHLMTFNQYKDAKTLFVAIQTRFSGNEATKKTQKTLLKQMYENFSASSTESLDSIFNRLQKIVSQLAILGENISQEDLNLKFLPSEWNTHVVVWRNKPDLDTMSFDDLYNNFKIVEHEVKGTASSSSSSSSQNVSFVSSTSSTNEVNTAHTVSTTNTQVSPASTQVSTASTQISTANLYDLEEMDLKWQLALLSMRTRKFFQKTGRKITINGSDTAGYDKSKVECFNCHKLGHFIKEYRGPRNQDSRSRNQDSSRRTINVEETSSKAMLAIDGASFNLSYMTDDDATIRTVLSLAVSRDWPIHQLDVKNAFLHGHLSETVYMHKPLGFVDPNKPNYVCHLQRSLYGLKQAPRAWFQRFASYATRVASSSAFLQWIIASLHSEFAMKDLGSLNYFLGISAQRSASDLFLSQSKFAEEKIGYEIKKARNRD
ncbi:ribonuclease H-like domain-containing protein [Tanacetum coccineum]